VAKRALCVGINDYPYEGSDLNGCVNDARAWADLLSGHFDFPTSEITLVLDAEATKARIVEGLKALFAGARTGDVLVFTNSSHGSYVADTSGDEPKYDEIVCPYDVADNAIADDELRELFTALPQGVHAVAIMDNCHSGTITRAAIDLGIPGLSPPDRRRVRFLNPGLRGDPVLPNPWKATPKRKEKHPESGMTEILLTGCTDKEYSYDALIDGVYHGAMTFHAIKAIRDANHRITYAELHARLGAMIDEAGYAQHPQLEGSDRNKERQIFV
jgi:metacaspase-1